MNQPRNRRRRRWRWLSGGRQRRQEEIILMLLCALSIPSILPFGVYRLLQGSWPRLRWTWRWCWACGGDRACLAHRPLPGGQPDGDHLLFGRHAATVYLRGVTLVYWVYPTMIAAYFVLRPTVALAINSVTLVGWWHFGGQLEVVNLLTIVVTIGLVNLFAYIFATAPACRTRNCTRRWSWIS
jgi:hypothetical protein